MKTLPSQSELKALLDYDPLTGILVWKPRPISMFSSKRAWSTWNSRYANQEAFTAVDKKGYRIGAIHNILYRASRIIFKLVHGIDPDQVDHDNRDRQNNKLINLVNVTNQQNQRNMKKASNNTSGITGVVWNKEKQKWDARITVDQKQINLGRFDNINDAALARKNAEIKYGFHKNHGT